MTGTSCTHRTPTGAATDHNAGISNMVGFVKHDAGKLRYDLMPTESLKAIVETLTQGAAEYGDDNWKLNPDDARFYAAAMRHMEAWRAGEVINPDSGVQHLAHAAANLVFLIYTNRERD